MKTMFKDPKHARLFDERGYMVVPLLNSSDVEDLYSLYRQFEARCYPVLELVEAGPIHKAIADLLGERLTTYLRDFDPIGGAFVTKDAKKCFYQPHQDCTWVDEDVDYMISVWVPLIDVTTEDGVLGIIPGSHRLPLPTHRIVVQFFDPCLSDYFELIPVGKGDAILFNARMIHGSLPNWSGARRTTVIAAVKHKDSQLITYSRDTADPNMTKIYAVDTHFLRSQIQNDVRRATHEGKPVNLAGWPLLGTIRYSEPHYSSEDWKRLLTKQGISVNPQVRSIIQHHQS